MKIKVNELPDTTNPAPVPLEMMIAILQAALRDALALYDRIAGNAGHGDGWTAADVRRLEEIRKLAGV